MKLVKMKKHYFKGNSMKKTLLILSVLSIGSLLALGGNLPTGTINPVAGTKAQVGYQAPQEIGYQAPNAGTEAQVGYQADLESNLSTRAEAMHIPQATL